MTTLHYYELEGVTPHHHLEHAGCRIFIGGLPPNVTKPAQIQQLLRPLNVDVTNIEVAVRTEPCARQVECLVPGTCSKAESVQVQGRGFAHVSVADPSMVTRVIQSLHQQRFHGSYYLRVEPAALHWAAKFTAERSAFLERYAKHKVALAERPHPLDVPPPSTDDKGGVRKPRRMRPPLHPMLLYRRHVEARKEVDARCHGARSKQEKTTASVVTTASSRPFAVHTHSERDDVTPTAPPATSKKTTSSTQGGEKHKKKEITPRAPVDQLALLKERLKLLRQSASASVGSN